MRNIVTRRKTRTETIVDMIGEQIAEGILKPGERILSVREAAAVHGVSKNTVAEAYDRLVAEGSLEARQGSGFYVAEPLTLPASRPSEHVSAALDLVSLLREQLDKHYAVRPGDGRPPENWTESADLRKVFARTQGPKGRGIEHGYGSSWGYQPLRERVAQMLGERSIKATDRQVLLTHGANHGLDLVIRYMLEPGDVVFVDDPGYYPLHGKLKLARIEIVGIRRGEEGPDLDDLAAKLEVHRPKLFFTQSQGHNPTGRSLTMGVAYGLLQLAERHDFRIVEDDVFADILPSTAPRLAALDQLHRVITVGSFSKTLSASLRCGYVAAEPELVAALCDVKMLTVVATSDFVERMVFDMIASGHYLRHLRRLRGRIAEAHMQAVRDLSDLGLAVRLQPAPGFYVWVDLPARIDEPALCEAAAAESIFLAPGQVFRVEKSAAHRPALRINVAHAADPRFLGFLRKALDR